MNGFKDNLESLFAESKTLEKEIQKQLNGLKKVLTEVQKIMKLNIKKSKVF